MSNTVKRLWVASIFFAGIAVGSGSRAAQGSEGAARNVQPQDAGSGTMADKAYDKKASHKKTLTGCLRKGEDANEYNLTAQDGATWDLTSDSVNLNHHVGQAVTVTGAVKDGNQHGHMMVTDLTKVSDHCQK